MALLEVDDLHIEARSEQGEILPIVKGVSFEVQRGEVMALIGESGSGKTTIALSSLGYTKPGLEFAGGEVRLDGRDVITMPSLERRDMRGRKVAYLAQSAAATFNPALTIGEQVTESAVLHGILNQEEANRRAEELYRTLELPDPDRLGRRYPHQVSGGQLQRLMAAMALCGKPDLLVLDEPTTALDVTTQNRGAQGLQASNQGGGVGRHLRHSRPFGGGPDRRPHRGALRGRGPGDGERGRRHQPSHPRLHPAA